MRKYRKVDYEDGTFSLIDVTEYEQEGDRFGAADINAITTAINQLNTGMLGWTRVWENENDNLAGLNYPGKVIPLNLDGYSEFRVICYINGMGSNITASAVISPRADGNSATANIMICSEGYNGGVILEGRAFSYSKSAHTLNIRDGWRWTSPSTYSAWHGQIKPAYIEAR